jgi:hypothetical protein
MARLLGKISVRMDQKALDSDNLLTNGEDKIKRRLCLWYYMYKGFIIIGSLYYYFYYHRQRKQIVRLYFFTAILEKNVRFQNSAMVH